MTSDTLAWLCGADQSAPAADSPFAAATAPLNTSMLRHARALVERTLSTSCGLEEGTAPAIDTFALFKTHKTASTTLQQIAFRRGVTRNLSFVGSRVAV